MPGSTVSTIPGTSDCDCALDLVETGVVHIQAQPVAGAMHVELLVAAVFQHFVQRSLAQPEIDVALRQHVLRRLVVRVEFRAPA